LCITSPDANYFAGTLVIHARRIAQASTPTFAPAGTRILWFDTALLIPLQLAVYDGSTLNLDRINHPFGVEGGAPLDLEVGNDGEATPWYANDCLASPSVVVTLI